MKNLRLELSKSQSELEKTMKKLQQTQLEMENLKKTVKLEIIKKNDSYYYNNLFKKKLKNFFYKKTPKKINRMQWYHPWVICRHFPMI